MIPQPLDQVPLFARLDQEEREQISSRLRHLEYNTNTVIFAANRPAEMLAVIVQGWVKLEGETPQGPIALANLGAGSVVGEVDVLLARPYSTSARAATTCTILTLARNDLQDLILQYPSIGLKFSAALGTRVAYLDEYLVSQRLYNHPLLTSLSDSDARALARRLQFRAYPRGETLFDAGDSPEAAYLIEEGVVRVITNSREGEQYDELGQGELVGQTALITGKPYAATGFAVTDLNVWMLARNDYQNLISEQPTLKLTFARALAERLGVDDQAQALERLHAMPLFADADRDALQAIAERLVLRHFPSGELIYAEGTPGDAMYFCEAGRVKLVSDAATEAEFLERVNAGEAFGEMALLTGRTRAEAAKAIDDTTVWVLYKTEYDDLTVQYPALSLALSRALSSKLGAAEGDVVERHLRQLNLFNGLSQTELRQVSQYVQPMRFRAGETICFAGQPAQFVYIIEAGEAREIAQGPNGQTIVLDLLGSQQSFGEQAVVQNSVYPVTVQSVGEIEVWAIAKPDFDRLLATYPALALSVTRRMADELDRATKRAPRPHVTQPMRPAPQYGQPQQMPQQARQQNYAPRQANGNGGNGNGGNGGNPYAPQYGQPQGMPQPMPQPARAQNAPLPGTSVGVRPAPSKPWERSGNVVRPMPAATARPTQQMSGANPYRTPRRRTTPGIFTWFSNLSVGNKIALGLVILFALWITVMLPLTLVIGLLSSGSNGNNTPPSDELPIVRTFREPLFGLKIAQSIKTPTPTPFPTPLPPTPGPTKKAVVKPVAQKIAPTPEPEAQVVDTTALAVPAAPAKPLPPREWDERVGAGGLSLLQGIGVRDATVSSGQSYWRLIRMKFENAGQESGDNHNIYVTLLDEEGKRVDDKSVELSWDQSGALEVLRYSPFEKQKPKGDYCECNYVFDMYGAAYRVRVDDALPSDQVSGMILPMSRHVNYRLTFQRVVMP